MRTVIHQDYVRRSVAMMISVEYLFTVTDAFLLVYNGPWPMLHFALRR